MNLVHTKSKCSLVRVLCSVRISILTEGLWLWTCGSKSWERGRKSLSFLELQQRVLDPLQQAVAHNCHLHRQTDAVISSAFGVDASEQATLLDTERFLCKEMWPVSLQCCGVVKVISKWIMDGFAESWSRIWFVRSKCDVKGWSSQSISTLGCLDTNSRVDNFELSALGVHAKDWDKQQCWSLWVFCAKEKVHLVFPKLALQRT